MHPLTIRTVIILCKKLNWWLRKLIVDPGIDVEGCRKWMNFSFKEREACFLLIINDSSFEVLIFLEFNWMMLSQLQIIFLIQIELVLSYWVY